MCQIMAKSVQDVEKSCHTDGDDVQKSKKSTSGPLSVPPASSEAQNDTMTGEDVYRSAESADSCGFLHYPKAVYFMLGNEFCERFSFYGMRAILTLYLVTIHQYPESTAKLIFHTFVAVCYATPLLGSILADGCFGRFRVILVGSIIYVLGHILLTLGAVPGLASGAMKALDFVGLFTIATATGGIKPCVSAFAADQFEPHQVIERQQFFSFFYFAINAGALLSKIITPILRGRVNCLGQQTCFPLAFGVPAILMFLALVLFLGGYPFYRIFHRKGTNILWLVCKVLGRGMKKRVAYLCGQKCSPRKCGRSHFVDFAGDKYHPILIDNVKNLITITIMFIPVTVFWALFDQQGSTWVLQARRMNGRVGNLTILPDQMSVLNPFLILILVPLFEMGIYPLLRKMNMLKTPLKRMGLGGILAAVSFIIAGFIQLSMVDKTMVSLPPKGHSRVFIYNTLPCDVASDALPGGELKSGLSTMVELNSSASVTIISSTCAGGLPLNLSKDAHIDIDNDGHIDRHMAFLVAFLPSALHAGKVIISSKSFNLEKAPNGETQILALGCDSVRNETLTAYQDNKLSYTSDAPMGPNGSVLTVRPPLYGSNLYQLKMDGCISDDGCVVEEGFEAHMGGIYSLVFYGDNDTDARLDTLVKPNTVSLLWQVPQYVVITTGELLFSITGLEFSYSQAAPSLKSVLQAMWLLTVFFGNVIDMAISGSQMVESPSIEFFIYAGLMAAVMVVFIILAWRYKYVVPKTIPEDALAMNAANAAAMEGEELISQNSKENEAPDQKKAR